MRSLTLIQPWATALLTMGKDVENRNWPPPASLLGQRIAIHAGAKFDKHDAWSLQAKLQNAPASYPQRALLGSVLLLGFVRTDMPQGAGLFDKDEWSGRGVTSKEAMAALASEWRAEGSKCLWLMRDPRPLAEPIPMKGSLGLWTVPEQYVAKLEAT